MAATVAAARAAAGPLPAPVSLARVAHAWWPLAASWLLMACELPALAAVVARLDDPAVNLAAYGGVVFPLSLLVESPVIMLLAAATALVRDAASYRSLRRFMHAAGALLTALHVLVAFTPLFDVVVGSVLHAPPELLEPARTGLRIMTPWTWSIAYRRFHQGVLIRSGLSRTVGLGTGVRLLANLAVLAAGWALAVPGVVAATAAVASGVVCEAVFIGLAVRPVLRERVLPAPSAGAPLSRRAFAAFYAPLALTSLLTLLNQPIGAAALARMPRALDSLAAWPVVVGVLFLTQSMGLAYNEVVVALAGEPGAYRALRGFALLLAAATGALLLALAATPLAGLWFGQVSGLAPGLAELARRALWIALPVPLLAVANNFHQGLVVHSRRTRAVPESVALYLATAVGVAAAGVAWQGAAGLYVGLAALVAGQTVQAAWLRLRSRETREALARAGAGRQRPGG